MLSRVWHETFFYIFGASGPSNTDLIHAIYPMYAGAEHALGTLRENPHMFYTPSFTLLYSRKGEMKGSQNEGLFSGLDQNGKRRCCNLIIL